MPAPLPRILRLLCVALIAGGLVAPATAARGPGSIVATQAGPNKIEAHDVGQLGADGSYRSPGNRHKLILHEPHAAARLHSQGAALVSDYSDFQVIDAPSRLADALVASGAAELRDDYNLILLNAGPIDTTTPAAAGLRAAPESFAGKRMQLVQFAGPIQPEWYDELLKTGVEIVTAIPQNAYLVYGDEAALRALDSLAGQQPAVQWDGPYRNTYRIHPQLLSAPAALLSVQLYRDPAANPATLALIDSLKHGDVYGQQILHYLNLVVPADPSAIPQIAARPDVVSISPYLVPRLHSESQAQILAGNVNATGPLVGDYLAQLAVWGFTQAQFDASGFVVDVTDSGLDNGTTSPNHFALYVSGLRPGTSRVAYSRLQGTPSPPAFCNEGTSRPSTLRGLDGHGTLDAHIVGGYIPTGAPYNAFPHAEANGLRYGMGIAPFVRLGSSVIFDPDCYTNPSYANLQSAAYQDGARISTNSWGLKTGGAYTADSQAYDALVRDAQPGGATFPAAGNQEMVIVFSAGNEGDFGANTVGSPASGKNVLTIGAAEGVQAFGGADGSGVDDSGANNYNDIISFSSRGPTDDGRQKPDLVAPGTHITGGVFQVASPGANGTADPAFTGDIVSGGTGGSPFFPAGQQWYTSSSGTSHAAPAAAGSAALVRQYFINRGLAPASPAMTKAFLANAARYLTGADANDTLPSPNQGMGMIDLGRAFASTPQILRDQRAQDIFTASGQSRTVTGVISDPAQPLRVTLAWTDAPGPTTGSAFLNDLNLAVTISGQTYLGNVFSGSTSVAGGTADPRNNLESVFLPAGFAAGTPFAVSVSAANIVADGVPNAGSALDQDFALDISNATEVSMPYLKITSVAFSGENFRPANGAPDPGETIALSVGLRNIGTAATTNPAVMLQAGGGVLNPSPAQSYGVLAPDGSLATRTFTLRVDPALACGGTLSPAFQAQEGATSYGTTTADLMIGTFVATAPSTGANSTALSIPAGAPATSSGAATAYPAAITIAGASGRIASVTVTLSGLTHSFPDDLDVLLVSPGGQAVMLMSDAGGGGDVSNINLTFADGAPAIPNALPIPEALTSGTYAPGNYVLSADAMPAPAPAEPYDSALAAFDGAEPNGTWSLYISDDEDGDVGSLAGGWSIEIATELLACTPASASATPASIVTSEAGGQATFVVVLNRAPTATVTIAASSSDTSEGTLSPAALTFTPANWDTPQTVTVTGVPDSLSDGDVAYTIVLAPAASADTSYNGYDLPDISAINVEGFEVFLPLVKR